MTTASKAILYLCLSIVPTACATSGYNHTMNDEVDVLMKRYDGQVPGASVLVVKDGTPVVRRSWGMSDLENLVSADSTYFTPGSKYQYSNSGYSLLALIVERASGKSFASFLHDRIFAPLG